MKNEITFVAPTPANFWDLTEKERDTIIKADLEEIINYYGGLCSDYARKGEPDGFKRVREIIADIEDNFQERAFERWSGAND